MIADTDWECVALLCDNDGIPDSVERRMKIFFGIMEKAKQYGIAPSRLHIDPLVVTLGTDQTALTVFAELLQKNQIRISGNPYHQWTFQHFLRTSGEKKY